jgi:hypothetical protein
MEPIESVRALTREDISYLRSRLIAVGLFFLFAVGLVSLVVFSTDFGGLDVTVYIAVGFCVLFFGAILYVASGFARDLWNGEKLVIKGELLEKTRHKSGNTGARRRRSTGSGSSPRYYLKLGDKAYSVEHKHYQQAQVGQTIALHYARYSRASLDVLVLSDRGIPLEAPEDVSPLDEWKKKQELKEQLPRREMALSEQDLNYLRVYRNLTARRYLLIGLFFGFLAVIFTLAGLLSWVMWIAAGILWLVSLFMARAAFKTLLKFRREKHAGLKLVILSRIIDKEQQTGAAGGYFLTTDYDRFTVSEEVYEKAQTQDQVFLFIGKHSGWFIDLKTKD